MANYSKEEQFDLINKGILGWRNLQYIDNQYEDVCIQAVKDNPEAIEYVKNQTEDICLEAIKQHSSFISKCKKRTPRLCYYALLHDYSLLKYKYIQKGIESFMNDNSKIEKMIFFTFNYSREHIDKKTMSKSIDPNYDFLTIDYNTLKNHTDFLVNNNSDNYFVFLNSMEETTASLNS